MASSEAYVHISLLLFLSFSALLFISVTVPHSCLGCAVSCWGCYFVYFTGKIDVEALVAHQKKRRLQSSFPDLCMVLARLWNVGFLTKYIYLVTAILCLPFPLLQCIIAASRTICVHIVPSISEHITKALVAYSQLVIATN